MSDAGGDDEDEEVPVAKPGVAGRGDAAPEAAFDLWLRRGLHDMFDDVMREPIPDELLRLIEEDRGNR